MVEIKVVIRRGALGWERIVLEDGALLFRLWNGVSEGVLEEFVQGADIPLTDTEDSDEAAKQTGVLAWG